MYTNILHIKDYNLARYFDSVASKWEEDPLKNERAEITAKHIKQLDLTSNESLIDFGCGTGLLGFHLKDHFKSVFLVDSSKNMLKIADQKITESKILNVETIISNGFNAVVGKHSAIVTLMTLHHIKNIEDFFSNAHDNLEENGVLIIADLVTEDGSFHKHIKDYDGHNGFDVIELSNIAINAHFEVQSIEEYYDIFQDNYNDMNTRYPLFLLVLKKQE